MRANIRVGKAANRRRAMTEAAQSVDHRSSEHLLLGLQRQIGNQAVSRLLHQPGAPMVIQRLSLFDTKWTYVSKATRSGSGQEGVVFFEDHTPQGLVAKRSTDRDPALENLVAHAVHQELSGKKAKTPSIRLADENDRFWIGNIIEQHLGKELADTFKAAPQILLMEKVSGMTFRDLANKHSAVAISLLQSPDYVERLGIVTFIDLFLGNTDRVYSANFGNWMTAISQIDQLISLIDNFDPADMQSLKRAADWVDRDYVKLLLSPDLDKVKEHITDYFFKILALEENGRIKLAADQQEKFKRYLLRGLQRGRDIVLSKLAPRIGRRSRTLKKKILQIEGGEKAWKVLKARARYLRSSGKDKYKNKYREEIK